MTAIKQRRVGATYPSKPTFNELSEASALLRKIKVNPSSESLAAATEKKQARKPRLGQVIDILA